MQDSGKPHIPDIPFDNRTYPKAEFEIMPFEAILNRKNLDHSPHQLHRVGFFMIILITEGVGQHTIDFTDYPFEAPAVLTIRKDQVHRFNDITAKGYLLLFTDAFLISYLEKQAALETLQLFNEMLGSPKVALNEGEYQEVLELVGAIQTEYLERRDAYSLGIIRSLLHVLIGKLFRVKPSQNLISPGNRYLEAFIRFQAMVEAQCFHTRKVRDYAGQMGVSTKTLNNIVQAIIHKPAKTFIDEMAVMHIKRLLVNSTMSIKEIAYFAGFDEPTNLYKYFKRYTHTSPEVFRQSHL